MLVSARITAQDSLPYLSFLDNEWFRERWDKALMDKGRRILVIFISIG